MLYFLKCNFNFDPVHELLYINAALRCRNACCCWATQSLDGECAGRRRDRQLIGEGSFRQPALLMLPQFAGGIFDAANAPPDSNDTP